MNPKQESDVTQSMQLMVLPTIREGDVSPNGFHRKQWTDKWGQRWYVVICRCGDLLYRTIVEGISGRRVKVGVTELFWRRPDIFFFDVHSELIDDAIARFMRDLPEIKKRIAKNFSVTYPSFDPRKREMEDHLL